MPKSHTTNSQKFRLARGLRLRLDEDGQWKASLSRSSGEFYMAPELLLLIQAIKEGKTEKELRTSLQKKVAEVSKHIPSDAEITNLIADFKAAGLIVTNEEKHLLNDGFGDDWIQWAMVADEYRTQAYLDALQQSVTSKTEVLDVGSGTGLFSAASLHFGAKKVYAIEETSMSKKILSTLKSLNLPVEKFKLFPTHSADAQFPPSVNLVVSELFGNDPFEEGVIHTMREVGSRLEESTQYIPEKLDVHVDVIEVSGSEVFSRMVALQESSKKTSSTKFYNKFLQSVRASLDFNQLSFAIHLDKNEFKVISQHKIGSVHLAPPPAHVSLNFDEKIKLKSEVKNGALLLWYRAHLNKKITVSSHSHEKDYGTHWKALIVPLLRQVNKGEELSLKINLNDEEDYLNVSARIKNEVVASR